MNEDGIFEIREYLDGHGTQKNSEVVDITKEMEHFTKAGGSKMMEAEALDEEKQFIREIAELSKHKDSNTRPMSSKAPTSLTSQKPLVPSDDLEEIFSKLEQEDEILMQQEFEAEHAAVMKRIEKSKQDAYLAAQKKLAENKARNTVSTPIGNEVGVNSQSNNVTTNTTPNKSVAKTTPNNNNSSGSGWKAGFLGGNNSSTKKQKVTIPTTTADLTKDLSSMSLNNTAINATEPAVVPKKSNKMDPNKQPAVDPTQPIVSQSKTTVFTSSGTPRPLPSTTTQNNISSGTQQSVNNSAVNGTGNGNNAIKDKYLSPMEAAQRAKSDAESNNSSSKHVSFQQFPAVSERKVITEEELRKQLAAEEEAEAEYHRLHPEVEEPEKPNVFSQLRATLSRDAIRAPYVPNMKPLPKVPRGTTSATAFSGSVMERIV